MQNFIDFYYSKKIKDLVNDQANWLCNIFSTPHLKCTTNKIQDHLISINYIFLDSLRFSHIKSIFEQFSFKLLQIKKDNLLYIKQVLMTSYMMRIIKTYHIDNLKVLTSCTQLNLFKIILRSSIFGWTSYADHNDIEIHDPQLT